MAWHLYARLGRPLEAHNVSSPEAYKQYQAGVIALNRKARPALQWRDPFVADSAAVTPIVSGGRWVVVCADCDNVPSYDPEWQLACCPECGAIYDAVAPPADWLEIERLLMARPDLRTRHWTPDQSVAQLRAENAAHGVAA